LQAQNCVRAVAENGDVMPETIETSCRVLAVAAALAALPAHTLAAESDVAAFVQRINNAIAPVEPGDRAAIRAACQTLVAQSFDIDAMAPAITDEAWQRMNADQRKAYTSGLARRAASDCASHGGEIAGNTVELIGVRQGDSGDRLVAVRQTGGNGRTVIWQVRNDAQGALKAVDMTVDGRSLAASARRDAKRVLEQSGGNVLELIRSVGG
jgi:ABC-type transporter MlaC component